MLMGKNLNHKLIMPCSENVMQHLSSTPIYNPLANPVTREGNTTIDTTVGNGG
jgi:hypothetical protein